MGILKHEGQSLLRIGQIQRYVSSASFENTKEAHHHLQGTFQTQADHYFWPYAQLLQIMCQLVSTHIEFPVSHLLIIEDQGYCIRRALYLFLKKLMDATIAGIGGRSSIPFYQQLVAFRLCQKGKFANVLL